MTRHGKIALALVAFGAISLVAAPARAQETTSTAVYQAKPIHTPGSKRVTAHFEVMHMFPTGIQVRDIVNKAEIHTFTYSDRIRDRMLKMMREGGYQYGDKVKIEYLPSSQVAFKIEGKPSKPL